DDAKKFLNDYGLEKGFSIHRKCTDTSVEGDKQQKQELENVEFDIRNPVIITQKGRPPERVKSTIEIQDK
ncbi:20299_t:CDS:2, partial [Funneliformis geosporum]